MHQLDDMDMEELLRVNVRLSQENNKLLKKMRRAGIRNFWGRILFYLVMTGLAYYAYQYYMKDYVVQIQDMYEELQSGVNSVKDLPSKFGM